MLVRYSNTLATSGLVRSEVEEGGQILGLLYSVWQLEITIGAVPILIEAFCVTFNSVEDNFAKNCSVHCPHFYYLYP
jgi:hypothetical protein